MTVPLAIGVVLENTERHPDQAVFRGMTLAAEEANEQGGRWGREVVLRFERADGAHHGLPQSCVLAWQRLADDPSVIGIVGPGISDNCLPLREPVARGGVPTLNWSGTDEARGRWYFQFQWGSLADESDYLADLVALQGRASVGILRAGVVGDRYTAAFVERARSRGLDVVANIGVHVQEEDVTDPVRRIRRSMPDALLFLGMGEPTLAFGRALRSLDWEIPRYANIAMLAATLDHDACLLNDGIVWTDQYEPNNAVRRHVDRLHQARFEEPSVATGHVGVGYDMVSLLLEGLERSPHPTRDGLLVGLERVRNLSSATGGNRTVMGFGPWERSALKGPDLFVYRSIRNGEASTYVPG